MIRIRSLRSRVLLSFVASALVLGPLVAASILLVSFQLEERAIERVVESRLQAVVDDPAEFQLRTSARVPATRILSSQALDTLPTSLFDHPDGVHEYNHGTREWFIAIRTLPSGARLAVVENTDALERRERISRHILAGGSVVTVYLSLWLGFWISGRLLRPIETLAQRISTQGDAPSGGRFDDGLADDEIGALARTLDSYRERMFTTLQRERAFSSDASHELRNPLAVVQSSAEILARDAGISPASRRAAARVLEAARQMEQTVTTLLLLARERVSDPHFEDVALVERIATLVSRARHEYPDRPISVHHAAEPVARAPGVAIDVVIGNLLRNALQHAAGDEVAVTLLRDRVVIEDRGTGIPDAEIERILEPGVRGSQARGAGSGLGLPLVKRVCERFGWTLKLSSESGRGTRAEFVFGTGATTP